MSHIPVLLNEVIKILNPQPGEFFIDGTIGSGGHAAAILEKIGPTGKLLGVDWDKTMIEQVKEKIAANSKFQIPNSKIVLAHGNYADLPEILKKQKLPKADGLLLDLGFSSEQLESSGRGFSFLKDEPLIMRYAHNSLTNADCTRTNADTISPVTAAEVINSLQEKELADIFYKYGEERYSRQIAKKIVEERRKKRILTTFELAEVIKKAAPRNYEKGRIHPATRVFQALRIFVNRELENLERILKKLDKVIKNSSDSGRGGRVVIISFHSLEDRLVKNYFREMAKNQKAEILTRKPIRPSEEEIKNNPRSRPAKLRACSIISIRQLAEKKL